MAKGVFEKHARAKIVPFNDTIPPNNTYAVSVSMPTWENVETYVHRRPGSELVSHGYPRIYVHPAVLGLSSKAASCIAATGFQCLPFPSAKSASRCFAYVQSVSPPTSSIALWSFASRVAPPSETSRYRCFAQFFAVLVPDSLFQQLKTYWRHSGDGLSPRHATFLIEIFDTLDYCLCQPLQHDQSLRFVRDLKLQSRRHASLEVADDIAKAASLNSLIQIDADDVLLYPTGMSAIYATARAIENIFSSEGQLSFVLFGFPYTDTLKMLEKLCRPKCLFMAGGSATDLDRLENLLRSGLKLHGLFCEFPSNPLLSIPDLLRIQSLSNQYGFVVACDDTIATFANVDLSAYVDVIMTSLTKFFSGEGDVMGGSVLANPRSKHYSVLHDALVADHEEIWFPDDVQQMLINGKTFGSRLETMNRTASAFASWLQQEPLIEKVLYPSLSATKSNYDRCLKSQGEYGGLLSLVFHSDDAAVAFYDALDVPKGPSLGFNFTLATPYTLFGHHDELEWAAEHGVPEFLVRISFGLEPIQNLRPVFEKALEEARIASSGHGSCRTGLCVSQRPAQSMPGFHRQLNSSFL